ncbi:MULTISPECIES: hypothetical protein [Pseudanabaena]|uniref:Uncharacterized protein n=2 Tax=Pseudanabaena TaxID=1152 RepID=L8N0B4_9CYAN|nr:MULTISPECIES: hypothetical protein [Pseudanabaena]ELS33657.1 hypothetical protein Pse7429DRAFT_1058 [Pseudanabaena biceps PCC 7429]MDG3494151.1 hypothetical protein [Pseudanabaena catenata USMAC16]
MTRKDIFIDNNIAKNFSNPLDPEYKQLIKWLIEFDANPKNMYKNAHLVVSNKLLNEYLRTMGNATLGNNILRIIDTLTKQGRLIKISNEQIKEFQREHFTNKVKKRLVSNKEDREHIPVVLLSDRKYALTLDEKFTDDLINFPSFTATVGKKPSDIPYDK